MTESSHQPDPGPAQGASDPLSLPVLDDAEPEGSRWGRAHHVLLAFLAAALVVWLLTGFYQIGASEVGLVERMGTLMGSESGSASLIGTGLHYGMPWPIDLIYRIPIRESRRVKVDTFNSSTTATEELKKTLQMTQNIPPEVLSAWFDPYLITADKNVLNVMVTVQYHISDPEAYFMSVAHAKARNTDAMFAERDDMIAHATSHALIQEIGRTRVDDAIAQGKQELTGRLLGTTRREAALLNLGVEIEMVNLEVIRWPKALDAAFQASIEAQAQAGTNISLAKTYATQTQAVSDAMVDRIQSEARTYATQVIGQAKGEADRFNELYTKYQAAPDLTRISLYSDAVNTILQNVTWTHYVEPGQRTTIILPPPTDVKANGPTSGQPPAGGGGGGGGPPPGG